MPYEIVGIDVLPAAAALGDGVANPTTTLVGVNAMAWNPITASWDRVRVNGSSHRAMLVERVPADIVVEGKSGANAAQTLTLGAAGAGLFHYVTNIWIARSCTTAIAGTALLDITTTNFGGTRWSVGNALAVGATQIDVNIAISNPWKSAVANTATTIVIPAIGATGISQAFVRYYTDT